MKCLDTQGITSTHQALVLYRASPQALWVPETPEAILTPHTLEALQTLNARSCVAKLGI